MSFILSSDEGGDNDSIVEADQPMDIVSTNAIVSHSALPAEAHPDDFNLLSDDILVGCTNILRKELANNSIHFAGWSWYSESSPTGVLLKNSDGSQRLYTYRSHFRNGNAFDYYVESVLLSRYHAEKSTKPWFEYLIRRLYGLSQSHKQEIHDATSHLEVGAEIVLRDLCCSVLRISATDFRLTWRDHYVIVKVTNVWPNVTFLGAVTELGCGVYSFQAWKTFLEIVDDTQGHEWGMASTADVICLGALLVRWQGVQFEGGGNSTVSESGHISAEDFYSVQLHRLSAEGENTIKCQVKRGGVIVATSELTGADITLAPQEKASTPKALITLNCIAAALSETSSSSRVEDKFPSNVSAESTPTVRDVILIDRLRGGGGMQGLVDVVLKGWYTSSDGGVVHLKHFRTWYKRNCPELSVSRALIERLHTKRKSMERQRRERGLNHRGRCQDEGPCNGSVAVNSWGTLVGRGNFGDFGAALQQLLAEVVFQAFRVCVCEVREIQAVDIKLLNDEVLKLDEDVIRTEELGLLKRNIRFSLEEIKMALGIKPLIVELTFKRSENTKNKNSELRNLLRWVKCQFPGYRINTAELDPENQDRLAIAWALGKNICRKADGSGHTIYANLPFSRWTQGGAIEAPTKVSSLFMTLFDLRWAEDARPSSSRNRKTGVVVTKDSLLPRSKSIPICAIVSMSSRMACLYRDEVIHSGQHYSRFTPLTDVVDNL